MRFWRGIECGFHFIALLLENKLSGFLFKPIRFNILQDQQQPLLLCPSPSSCFEESFALLWCRLKSLFYQFCYKLGEGKQRSPGTWCLPKTCCFSLSSKWLGLVRSWGPPQGGELKCKQSCITKWCHPEPMGTVGLTWLATTSNAHRAKLMAEAPSATPSPLLPSPTADFQRTEAENGQQPRGFRGGHILS